MIWCSQCKTHFQLLLHSVCRELESALQPKTQIPRVGNPLMLKSYESEAQVLSMLD